MRLLLAEDEKSLSKAITAILKKNHYTVDAAYDGVEALEYINANEYDGIILDVMMPRLDGIDVLQTLRAQGNATPVIMLTAKAEVEDKVLGLDSGANDYLTKPFGTGELLARVRALTRRQGEVIGNTVTAGDLTLRLDARQLFFGVKEMPEEPLPTLPAIPTPIPTPDGTEGPTDEPTPTPVAYGPNTMDIDFAALAENAPSDTLKSMHQWFGSREATLQNEYTGAWKGKNLIFIVAEGFSRYAITAETTPTLYKLAHEGFVCDEFYNPLWWVSTSDGEYVADTSMIPKSGVWSFYRSSENWLKFCLGNQLRGEGYATRAYHNHTYTYYKRHLSHPNMGYDYKGVGNGLEVKKTWPESDVEMMEKTIPEYINDEHFHTYYMTVSGHMLYTFMGNYMSAKHKDEVGHEDFCEEARAYLACQMELDKAIEYLIEELRAADTAKISEVPGITANVAEEIYRFFNKKEIAYLCSISVILKF